MEAPAENLSAQEHSARLSDAFRRIFAAIISQLIEEGRVTWKSALWMSLLPRPRAEEPRLV